jgi:hypothetical protein
MAEGVPRACGIEPLQRLIQLDLVFRKKQAMPRRRLVSKRRSS